ncbi:TPR repeat protein [Sphingobium sp. SYK-6]|uniref:hypothetical protein n=1 Tax=Sphingobium sp. (strain NBRC 103272 / SYK-6) TaxID=627192 RepID=UPI000227726F|nr:TPR repeat protein [Sphingobium sp. SYK-6]
MNRALLTAFVLTLAVPAAAPAIAQETLSPEQVTAFNAAVVDFNAGQKAQQAGDHAGALAKYEAALPAIRAAVAAQPDNIDYVSFLANALYLTGAANAGAQKMDAVAPLYEESLPLWRKVVAAKPADGQSKMILSSLLIQVANAKLGQQDKAGALAYYNEALPIARQAVATAPNPQNRNLLLGGLIGASQASDDPAIKEEAATLSKAMLADGSVDAANKPAAEILGAAPPAT